MSLANYESMNKGKFVNAIAESCHLSKEDTVILQYGLKKIIMLTGDAVFTIMLGWFLGITALSIVFQMTFMVLRMHAGGYHSKTELQCTVHSAIVTVVSLAGIRMMAEKMWWSSPLFILVSAVIMLLAPVEAVNKPLTEKEKEVNHRKSIRFVLILDLIAIVSRIYGVNFFYAIAAAIYAAGALMLMGIFLNKISHE